MSIILQSVYLQSHIYGTQRDAQPYTNISQISAKLLANTNAFLDPNFDQLNIQNIQKRHLLDIPSHSNTMNLTQQTFHLNFGHQYTLNPITNPFTIMRAEQYTTKKLLPLQYQHLAPIIEFGWTNTTCKHLPYQATLLTPIINTPRSLNNKLSLLFPNLTENQTQYTQLGVSYAHRNGVSFIIRSHRPISMIHTILQKYTEFEQLPYTQ